MPNSNATRQQKTAAADESPLGIEKVPFSSTLKSLNLVVSALRLGLSRFREYFMSCVQQTIKSRQIPYITKKQKPYEILKFPSMSAPLAL